MIREVLIIFLKVYSRNYRRMEGAQKFKVSIEYQAFFIFLELVQNFKPCFQI